MPRTAMPRTQFHSYTEARINGWTQTHSQIARQLAFYYEEDGICYPRFTLETSYADLFAYMQNWAAKYFIPNPYAPSLKDYTPTCIYGAIVEAINNGNTDFDSILDSMFGVKLSSHDKVRVYLSNFTDLLIGDDKQVTLNERTFGKETILNPDVVYATDAKKYFEYFGQESQSLSNQNRTKEQDNPLQQIFYGAPGTGKSHRIKDNEDVKRADEKNLVFRTTFHPDSDYSTFVGAYKPTMKPVADKYKAVAGKDEEITYSFVPQAFLQAYAAAWNNPDEKVFLVIEEINRGNCAQIFGDLFQLLDRDGEGYSEYPIKADRDLAKYLNGCDEDGREVLTNKAGIKDGKLYLPSNLYIWATMNTSDQSLFPIDSAFKRRWEWTYIPIDTEIKSWFVDVKGTKYEWSDFLKKVNTKIYKATQSEDKQLGFFFCKAEGEKISAQKFVSKVLFYLWNDVFKDYSDGESIFKASEGEELSFSMFYRPNGSINEDKVEQLLIRLGVNLYDAADDNDKGIV